MNRPGPARPGRFLTPYFSILLKDTSLKLSRNKAPALKIVVSNFHGDFFISSEVIAFLAKTDFAISTNIFAYNSRTT